MMTESNEPLNVVTTPYSASSDRLEVTKRSVNEIVVEDIACRSASYEFTYVVIGTWEGYADKEVVRESEEQRAQREGFMEIDA